MVTGRAIRVAGGTMVEAVWGGHRGAWRDSASTSRVSRSYRQARLLAEVVGEYVPHLEGHYRSLGWQMFDAECSVPLNIAESTGRRTPRDRARFLDIANGSARETASAALIADGWDIGPPELRARILDPSRDIVAMLTVQARRQRSRSPDPDSVKVAVAMVGVVVDGGYCLGGCSRGLWWVGLWERSWGACS